MDKIIDIGLILNGVGNFQLTKIIEDRGDDYLCLNTERLKVAVGKHRVILVDDVLIEKLKLNDNEQYKNFKSWIV